MRGQNAPEDSFRRWLRAHRAAVLGLLLAAFGLRLCFIFVAPHPSSWDGDPRYRNISANLLAGRGYSFDTAPPYAPTIASSPAYPLFTAAVYAVAGPRADAVRVAQAALDLLTCLLVAYVAFRLAPPGLRGRAAFAALAVYGLLSWFTMIWTACLLTETLTLFFTTLMLALCARGLEGGRRGEWVCAGLACGLAILARPDSVLLAAAVLIFLTARLLRRRSRAAAAAAVGFCLATALTLAPWTLRNYLVFGIFEPLASEYGCAAAECFFPTGYLRWVRTWLKDETHFDYAFEPAWPTGVNAFDAAGLPRDAYDSEGERRRVLALIDRYHRDGRLTPGLDADFRALAAERVRAAPLRFFVTLPLYRLASMWLTGFSTRRPTPYVMLLRVFSVLPLHLCALAAFALWLRGRPLMWLLLLVVLARSAFFGFHYAPETRYIVEAYPAALAACAVTAAAAWGRLGARLRGAKGGA